MSASVNKFQHRQPNSRIDIIGDTIPQALDRAKAIVDLIEAACTPCCGAKIGEQHKDWCNVEPYPDFDGIVEPFSDCHGPYIAEPYLNWRGQLISDIFDTIKCDYSGTPPFADAEWANTKDPLCLWCAGTGHPHADEAYGMCECPGIYQDKAAIDLLNDVKGGAK